MALLLLSERNVQRWLRSLSFIEKPVIPEGTRPVALWGGSKMDNGLHVSASFAPFSEVSFSTGADPEALWLGHPEESCGARHASAVTGLAIMQQSPVSLSGS